MEAIDGATVLCSKEKFSDPYSCERVHLVLYGGGTMEATGLHSPVCYV